VSRKATHGYATVHEYKYSHESLPNASVERLDLAEVNQGVLDILRLYRPKRFVQSRGRVTYRPLPTYVA
jgi:hypothetical protein